MQCRISLCCYSGTLLKPVKPAWQFRPFAFWTPQLGVAVTRGVWRLVGALLGATATRAWLLGHSASPHKCGKSANHRSISNGAKVAVRTFSSVRCHTERTQSDGPRESCGTRKRSY